MKDKHSQRLLGGSRLNWAMRLGGGGKWTKRNPGAEPASSQESTTKVVELCRDEKLGEGRGVQHQPLVVACEKCWEEPCY